MCDVCAFLCAFCCIMFAPFIFQTVGFFTPMWASNSTCDSIGLLYSCCAGGDNATCGNTNGEDELDARALGLHATSFAIMFLAVFCSCCASVCCDSGDDKAGFCVFGVCFFLFYPVAGLFSVIGCIIVATKYSTSELGYSFYLCLTAGCLIIVLIILGCFLICKSSKSDNDYPKRHSSPVSPSDACKRTPNFPSYSGASDVTPYSGAGESSLYKSRRIQTEHEAHHHDLHDEEPRRIFVFLRKIGVPFILRKGKVEDGGQHATVRLSDGYGRTPFHPDGAASVMPYSGTEGVAPYEQRQAATVENEAPHATVHHPITDHDEETGAIFVFKNKINFMRMRIFSLVKDN